MVSMPLRAKQGKGSARQRATEAEAEAGRDHETQGHVPWCGLAGVEKEADDEARKSQAPATSLGCPVLAARGVAGAPCGHSYQIEGAGPGAGRTRGGEGMDLRATQR